MEILGNNFKRNKNSFFFSIRLITNIVLLIAAENCEGLEHKGIDRFEQNHRIRLLSDY